MVLRNVVVYCVMITAEEFFSENNGLYTSYSVKNKKGKFTPVCSFERAIEFAELHVKAALKAASESETDGTMGIMIYPDSILNSYPLDLIK